MLPKPVRLPALLVGAFLFASPVWAQQPTPAHLALARELVGYSGANNTIERLIPSFSEQVRRQVVTRPDLTKDVEEVLKSLQPEMELQRQQILNTLYRIYTRSLSEAEMRDVIAFFKTPSGAKYITVQSGIVDDVVDAIQNWGDEANEYLMTRTRAEMSKRGHEMQ